jgi:hypothetical protein
MARRMMPGDSLEKEIELPPQIICSRRFSSIAGEAP